MLALLLLVHTRDVTARLDSPSNLALVEAPETTPSGTPDMSLCPHQCYGHGIRCDVVNSVHVCVCAEGYSGTFCHRAHRSTRSVGHCRNECSGRGLCNIKTGECVCEIGFSGNDCSRLTPELTCSSLNYCSGKGRCAHLPESALGYECICLAGFTGPDCSHVIDLCGGCRHGFCDVTTQTCQCYKGYDGDHCDLYSSQSDPCLLSQFCSANGRCLEGTSVCVCASGTNSPNCETFPTQHNFGCPSKNRTICSNAGMCTKNRTCSCNPGYSGDFCQHRPCESGCLHGNCEVRPDGSFSCVCHESWTGEACDHSTNEESDGVCCENDCSSHGVCQNCQCNCFDGFKGDKCETMLEVVEEDVMADVPATL